MDDRDGVILQLYSRARAPNRDYYGLTITNDEVVLNIWNITHGPHIFPKKQRCPLGDLQIAKQLLSEIHRLFGLHVVEFAISLSCGEAKLECLPTRAFLKILRSLATNDILKLGQTSKIFFELCNRNDAWGIIFRKRNKAKPSRDELKVAETKGWKIVLKNKLIWSDRLKRIGKHKPNVLVKDTLKQKQPIKRASSASVGKKAIDNETNEKVVEKVPELELLYSANENQQKSILKSQNISISNNGDLNGPSIKNFEPTTFIPKSVSSTGVPIKGILKKSSSNLNTSKTIARFPMDYMPKLQDKEEPTVTTIDYTPLRRTKLSSMSTSKLGLSSFASSLIGGRAAKNESLNFVATSKDRHLDRYLSELDKKEQVNPFKMPDDQQFANKLKITQSLSNASTKCTTKKSSSAKKLTTTTTKGVLNKNDKLQDFLVELNNDEDPAGELMMTSKFESYLNSLKGGKSVHPSMQPTMKKKKPSDLSKKDIIPKITELGRSITSIRSSFYGTDKLKISMNLKNNTKVTNKNGQVQQLNNKLNALPSSASTSALEIKKNMIKNHCQSATTSNIKVKNTNCGANKKIQNSKSANKIQKKTMNVKTNK